MPTDRPVNKAAIESAFRRWSEDGEWRFNPSRSERGIDFEISGPDGATEEQLEAKQAELLRTLQGLVQHVGGPLAVAVADTVAEIETYADWCRATGQRPTQDAELAWKAAPNYCGPAWRGMDTAPRDWTVVLLWCNYLVVDEHGDEGTHGDFCTGQFDPENHRWLDMNGEVVHPTHWTPAPKGPDE